MENRLRVLAGLGLVGALLVAGGAGAQTFGTTSTLSDVSWIFSSNVNPLNNCNELRLDATANWSLVPSRFIAYGVLNCPAWGSGIGYAAYGAGYGTYLPGTGLDIVHLALDIAKHKLFCNLQLPSLAGSCEVSYNGNTVGFAAIVLR